MGADLCGHIMVGPRKLDPAKVKKAREFMAKLVVQAKQKRSGKELKSVLADKYAVEQLSDGSENVGDAIAAISRLDGIVDDFLQVWECQYRDQMARDLPGKKGWQIVVAGERTWGDGPEIGSAWYVCDRIVQLGLYGKLGLK